MDIYKKQVRHFKIGTGIALTVAAFGVTGFAQASFVKTVSSEAECTAQDGTVMDLNGTQHCLVPVISPEFQKIEYAGELRGVTTCTEENTRKTQIGDFCLIALEEKMEEKPAQTTSTMTDKMMDMAKDEAEKSK
ncbi:MAG: hypothetical protein COA91_03980 [Robiginitomaculum sp.]|nr:MAG: hypothetical protein COA91_03980 [Robiginitomaculum sp.]